MLTPRTIEMIMLLNGMASVCILFFSLVAILYAFIQVAAWILRCLESRQHSIDADAGPSSPMDRNDAWATRSMSGH